MGIIGELNAVVILFGSLHGGAIVPGEGEVLAFPGEVIFHMALGTGQGPHLLVGGIPDILAHRRETFYKGGTADHRFRIVTVGAADGVDDLMAPVRPGLVIECCYAH